MPYVANVILLCRTECGLRTLGTLFCYARRSLACKISFLTEQDARSALINDLSDFARRLQLFSKRALLKELIMFDKEFAKKQITLLPDSELAAAVSNEKSGEFVPEYYELAREELKKRGVDLNKAQTPAGPAREAKSEGARASVFVEHIRGKMGINALETEELIELYKMESGRPFFMSLIERELGGRHIDVKTIELEKQAEASGPVTQKECKSCGTGHDAAFNFCPFCGNPL